MAPSQALRPFHAPSLHAPTCAQSDQEDLFSHPTHDCSLGSLLLLNRCQLFPFSHYFSWCLTSLDFPPMQWPHGIWELLSVVSTFTVVPEYGPSKQVSKTHGKFIWKAGNSAVSHFVGLYCRFHFAKTGIDVSDKMVFILTAPLWLQQCTLHYISHVKSFLHAARLGERSNLHLKEWCFCGQGVDGQSWSPPSPLRWARIISFSFWSLGFWCSSVLFRQPGLKGI